MLLYLDLAYEQWKKNGIMRNVDVLRDAIYHGAVKRVRPKARGSAGPIRKRNSHIRIVLTDEVPIVRRADKVAKPKSRKKASPVVPAETAAPITPVETTGETSA